ncbi:unnamed protein product [Didymodactylos carnosus]|uniref:Uncharacterized protein n=1 Tax=Didymodactylos carnosus TaxID=1234261 RepID=A0A814TMY6_9BILA|nr:unnamed protein product [Didymodactylos carnosus]CAF3882087.1 unnamed protein product [Didymodactylos carnosus]CAF3925897.1 unnamed protein product [Didymodactylos carnosus]
MSDEGIASLLTHIDQLNPLKTAYEKAAAQSMQCAVYSRWFFDGHPVHMGPIDLNQRDASFNDLADELAIVGTRYYSGSTIS